MLNEKDVLEVYDLKDMLVKTGAIYGDKEAYKIKDEKLDKITLFNYYTSEDITIELDKKISVKTRLFLLYRILL